MNDTPDGSRIAWPLRTWLVIEVLFGLGAILSIGLNPADSANNFAWPIKPDVTAALLGAFYLASALELLAAALARRWEDVRILVVPAILFTSAELIATFLHWERFSVASLPFWIWFASYLLPPPIFAACYLWQKRREVALPRTMPFPGWLRLVMVLVGAAIAYDAVSSFIWPELMIAAAPWQLTPLTTRALCGWAIAVAAMLFVVALENDRRRARVLSPFFICLLPAIVLQLNRFGGEVDWTHWRIIANGVILVIIAGIGIYIASAGWRDFFLGRSR